jgi:hypothetical protein
VTISPAQISKPQDSTSISAISQFLVVAGEVYRIPITSALVAIWQRELGHIAAEPLREAMHRALRECRFFPTIAEVLGIIPTGAKREDVSLTITRSRVRRRRNPHGPVPACEQCQSTGYRANENNQFTLCECRKSLWTE